eukprot:gene4597-biopygen10457
MPSRVGAMRATDELRVPLTSGSYHPQRTCGGALDTARTWVPMYVFTHSPPGPPAIPGAAGDAHELPSGALDGLRHMVTAPQVARNRAAEFIRIPPAQDRTEPARSRATPPAASAHRPRRRACPELFAPTYPNCARPCTPCRRSLPRTGLEPGDLQEELPPPPPASPVHPLSRNLVLALPSRRDVRGHPYRLLPYDGMEPDGWGRPAIWYAPGRLACTRGRADSGALDTTPRVAPRPHGTATQQSRDKRNWTRAGAGVTACTKCNTTLAIVDGGRAVCRCTLCLGPTR